MDKPDHKGQNPMATNGTSSKVDELLKTGDRGNREEAQKVRLVETRNRFVLLNEEGEDIEGDNITQDKPTNMNEEPDISKDAWKRKQERIVNAKFRTHTTQEERFEAKRYILDGLVPLDSTISEWSVYIIDYFRQLCSVFEFGEGLQAVSRERLNSWKTHGMDMDNDEEEVDSEVDGTADLMKTDGSVSLDSNPKPTAGPNEFLSNRMSLEDGIPSGAQNRRWLNRARRMIKIHLGGSIWPLKAWVGFLETCMRSVNAMHSSSRVMGVGGTRSTQCTPFLWGVRFSHGVRFSNGLDLFWLPRENRPALGWNENSKSDWHYQGSVQKSKEQDLVGYKDERVDKEVIKQTRKVFKGNHESFITYTYPSRKTPGSPYPSRKRAWYGQKSSSRLALNSLSRKTKEVYGSPVGGKGHTTFVKLNIDDFVNEATVNPCPKSSPGPQLGEKLNHQVEGVGPIGDDLGLKFMDNGVAMAIDEHTNRDEGINLLKAFEGLTEHQLDQISGTADGSVTTDISRAMKEAKKSITFKKDKSAVVHVGLGRVKTRLNLYHSCHYEVRDGRQPDALKHLDQGLRDQWLFMTPLAPKYYVNYKLMKKNVKQFARQIKAGGLELDRTSVSPSPIRYTLGEAMNFLGLRSQSTAAQVPQALPPQALPPQVLAESNNRKPTATLEDLVAEDPFPLASLVETFDGRSEEISSDNGAFGGLSTKNGAPAVDKHIDVCEEEGWIIIPCKELSDSWNEEPDMLSFRSLDRPFVFPGEQVHILACLSAYKQDTEVITPFKVAEVMSKKGIGRNSKKQNGEVIHGSPVPEVASSPDAHNSDDNANGKTNPKKDVSTGESLLRMEDHRRQTEMLLQRFRNSHFFARIAEADEPLWSKRKTQETFRESTEMIGGKLSAYDDEKILPVDRGNPDASTSGGVARNGFKCSSLANGDIVVLLQVNIGVDCLKDPVLEIIQFEKYERSLSAEGSSLSYSNQLGDPCGDLLKWLLPLENSLASPSRSLSPPQPSSSSSSIRSTSTKMNSSGSSSSPIFSFGHLRSYSMSSVPPSTIPPPVSLTINSRSTLLEDQDHLSSIKLGKDEKGEGEGLMSFRGVPLEPERFSVRCGLQGIYIPGRRWRRKVEIIQPVEITSFTADCNTEDLLCVQIKNVSPAHMPDIVIYLDTITIIHEEASKGGPPLSLPIACIEAGNDHSLPDLALRRGEEHSFILKPATSLWRNNSKGPGPRLSSSVHGPPSNGVTLGDKYAVLVSCRCNYTESRLFFKQPTSWRPRMPRDLLISVASQMSRPTLGSDDRIPQLPVQVLTLEASNLTSEDLTLTVLAPASFSCLPSVVSLNSTPASPTDGDSRQGMALSDDSGPQTGSYNEYTISISDVLPTSDLGCTHLWLQSRVPLGCVPCRSTATIKLELLPLTDGIITLDSLQISVKEKGLTYVPEKSLKINATSSIRSGII
ncbi:hypothetical protein L1987_79570 [Smallanthus sonchifolius]|uniref:Uncharacterized protein n=1 Tax=Smallanthus sonchifolius TaxID=185202 RepID=A0ACB8ZGU5_9ASTR|nr:hypothetical protein L1987_79570 [Smallanthus sonchifolius]